MTIPDPDAPNPGAPQPPPVYYPGAPPPQPPPVWPPQPNAWPPQPAYYGQYGYTPPYFSSAGLAAAVIGFEVYTVFINALEIVLKSVGASTAYAIASGTDGLVTSLQGLFFLMWTHRIYKNLTALGVQGLSMSAGWLVGYFFIPILSFFRPYQAYQEVYKATDPQNANGPMWRQIPQSGLVLGWWLSSILSSVVLLPLVMYQGVTETSGHPSVQASLLEFVADGICIGIAILSILVIRMLTDRSDDRARALGMLPPKQ